MDGDMETPIFVSVIFLGGVYSEITSLEKRWVGYSEIYKMPCALVKHVPSLDPGLAGLDSRNAFLPVLQSRSDTKKLIRPERHGSLFTKTPIMNFQQTGRLHSLPGPLSCNQIILARSCQGFSG